MKWMTREERAEAVQSFMNAPSHRELPGYEEAFDDEHIATHICDHTRVVTHVQGYYPEKKVSYCVDCKTLLKIVAVPTSVEDRL